MTIIAYRDGKMAGDALITCGDVRVGHMQKIARDGAGNLCGAAGSAMFTAAFIGWFVNGRLGARPRMAFGSDGLDRAMIVNIATPDRITIVEDGDEFSFRETFHAIGSGAPFALGAMCHGATARVAVEIACFFSSTCGGEISVLHAEANMRDPNS